MASVLGVLGGSGGVGASSFAAVLAATAGRSVLVDLDVAGGGLDVLLGCETAPGARWSGLRLAGGHLDPAELLAGLPQWADVAVLAADAGRLDAGAVRQVLGAASSVAPVVVDLPRTDCAERAAALFACELVVVVVRGDTAGVVAAYAAVSALPELPVGLVVRRGAIGGREAAELIGRPLLGELPSLGAAGFPGVDAGRLPRSHTRVAAGILRGLATPRHARVAS